MFSTLKRTWTKLKERKEENIHPIANQLYRAIFNRKKYSLLKPRVKQSNKKLTHIAYFARSNAGDILLPVTLRDLFDYEAKNNWRKQHVHQLVGPNEVAAINKSNGLLIGGGGLFIRDTNKNAQSGWQWSCNIDQLRQIKVPMALFAVGYNRFRGQADFDPIFHEHLQLVAEKSVMIGMRNWGSVNKVKEYLPETLHHKVKFQPCMTTVTSRLYPEIGRRKPDEAPFISLNCAFDRSHLRFGEQLGETLTNLALAMKDLSKIVPIQYYAHCKEDEAFLPFMDSLEVEYKVLRLYNVSPKAVVEAYSKPLVALGMRGHAQLIPFGCERPIVSLISHNKLKYFLDDIDANKWGIEIKDPDLRTNLYTMVKEILDNMSECEQEVFNKQETLWQISLDNVAEIKQAFNK